MYFNEHILSGNVGRDAVLRETAKGKVLSFSMAHTSVYGDKKTTWYDVSVWGNRAESLEALIKKGTQILVSGESGSDEYTDKDGNKRFKMVFRANNVQLVGGKASGSSQDVDSTEEEEGDEDLPF